MTETATDPDQILATVTPSVPRRILGMTVLFVLGGLLIWLGLAKPPASLLWQFFLIGLGSVTLWLADALRRATARRLELTYEVLRESGGRVVARIEDIAGIDRGAFAIKPSNGFLLRLSASSENGNAWAPGLWWRLGRSVGVGGITPAAEAKLVAELIAGMLAARKAAAQDAADAAEGGDAD